MYKGQLFFNSEYYDINKKIAENYEIKNIHQQSTITDLKRSNKELHSKNDGLEIQKGILKSKIKKLASELIIAEKREQKRIAQLLHNDVKQHLFFIQTNLGLLKNEILLKYVIWITFSSTSTNSQR